MTTTRAIQISILFWALFIYVHNLYAGSGSASPEQALCVHTIGVVAQEKDSGADAEATIADFDGFIASPNPMRNPLYDTWAADMTRDMIRYAWSKEGWEADAMERCMRWARGELKAN